MKKIIFVILLVISVITFINAEQMREPLGGYKLDGKWHVFDYSGNIIFDPIELYQIGGYSEGRILVIKNIDGVKSWGFIDLTGKVTNKMNVDGAKVYADGMSLVHKCDNIDCQAPLYGYYDKEGNLTIPMKYLDATIFVDGIAWVMNKEERGFINKTGEFIFKAEDGVFGLPFIQNRAVVHNKDGRFGFINKKGEVVIPYQFDEAVSFSEDLAPVFDQGKFKYIDTNGKEIILTKRPYARQFKNGYAFTAEANDKYQPLWQVINKEGLIMTNEVFVNVHDFTEGLAAVQQENFKWVFIDPFGNKPFAKEYDYCDEFHNGLAWASISDSSQFGFVNNFSEYVIKLPKADAYVDFRVNRIVR